MQILLVGAGLGGHYQAAMAIADAWAHRFPSDDLCFVGRSTKPEDTQAFDHRCRHIILPRRTFPGLRHALYVRDAARILSEVAPDVLISTGGDIGFAAGLEAVRRRIPLFLQEQNVTMGRSNRLLLPFAKRCFTGFPSTTKWRLLKRKIIHSGTPIHIGDRKEPVAAARRFGFAGHRPILLVWGGSQGAESINSAVATMTQSPTPISFDILWITGPDNDPPAAAQHFPGTVIRRRYLSRDEVTDALSCATAAISRAGGVAIAEMIHMRVPSVLIPYSHAKDDHQRANAAMLAGFGAARILDPCALNPDALLNLTLPLLEPDGPATALRVGLADPKLSPGGASLIVEEIATTLGRC